MGWLLCMVMKKLTKQGSIKTKNINKILRKRMQAKRYFYTLEIVSIKNLKP